jgi:hypothetical protein
LRPNQKFCPPKELTADNFRLIGSSLGGRTILLISDEVELTGDTSWFGRFWGIGPDGDDVIDADGDDVMDVIDGDRLLNTLNIFERPRFFGGMGDVRSEFGVIVSIVELKTLSLRESACWSIWRLTCSRSIVKFKICPGHKFCDSFLSSSRFNRCLCSGIRPRRLGDSIATFIELSNNVRK